jgi:hypothetical protein
MTRTWLRVALAAAGALAVAGCGAQTVDIKKVEDNIESGVKEQNGVDVTVDCPDSVDWKTGSTFTCDVTQSDGTKNTAIVKMTSDDGHVTWTVR